MICKILTYCMDARTGDNVESHLLDTHLFGDTADLGSIHLIAQSGSKDAGLLRAAIEAADPSIILLYSHSFMKLIRDRRYRSGICRITCIFRDWWRSCVFSLATKRMLLPLLRTYPRKYFILISPAVHLPLRFRRKPFKKFKNLAYADLSEFIRQKSEVPASGRELVEDFVLRKTRMHILCQIPHDHSTLSFFNYLFPKYKLFSK